MLAWVFAAHQPYPDISDAHPYLSGGVLAGRVRCAAAFV